ncbi:MAG: iron ABC transporter permease [Pseudomonadota bacterium]
MLTPSTSIYSNPVSTRRPLIALFAGLATLAASAIALAIVAGSDGFQPGLLMRWLTGDTDPQTRLIIETLRLPRALSAFAVGGMLALAGALMQVLLRNPLADPYILGTSGGAACGALTALTLGLSVAATNLAAFAGALLSTVIVFGFGGFRHRFSPTALLLTGVVLASGFGAIVSLLLALSPDNSLRGMLFWLMGDFSLSLTPTTPLALLALAGIATTVCARPLDLLAESPDRARILGLPLLSARAAVLALASLLTAYSVTVAGSIGFIGLVVPHLVRHYTGPRHSVLVPAAIIAGGALLCTADVLSRTVAAPRQLPVGTLTAMIGVPLFLYLLRNRYRAGRAQA